MSYYQNLLIIFCFVIGITIKTRIGNFLYNELEEHILSKIPGLVGANNVLGILLVSSVLLGAAISLIVFVINYGNCLTCFRKAVYEIMLKN